MEKISKNDLTQIERQMFNKARDIDVCAFNCLSSDFPKEIMLDALSMYQNKDGGFGHGVEPDNLNPNSTVFETYMALLYCYQVGFTNYKENEVLEQMLNKTFNYLYNRKPVWSVYDETNLKFAAAARFQTPTNSTYPKPAIVAFTIYFLDNKKAYYKKAIDILNQVEKELLLASSLSFEEAFGYKLFFEVLKKKGIKVKSELLDHFQVLKDELINRSELSEVNALYFVILDAKREEALDLIVNSRKVHGLWEVSHEWGNNYPEAESAKLKWLGLATYRSLYVLKQNNRIMED